MRKWSPSKKMVGFWAGAVLLAAMSLPSPPLLPQSGERHRDPTPAQTMPHVGAIPTMASFDEDAYPTGKPIALSASTGIFQSTAYETSAVSASPVSASAVSASEVSASEASSTAVDSAGTNSAGANQSPAQGAQNKAASQTKNHRNPVVQNEQRSNDKQSRTAPGQAAPRQQQPSPRTQQPGQAQQPSNQTQQSGQAQQPSNQTQQPGQVRPPDHDQPAPAAPQQLPELGTTGGQSPFTPYVAWPTAKLRVRVIDGRTLQPLQGAEVVLIETEQRVNTDENGYTPWIDAPILRNPRYRPMVAELHGQLGVIAYKNGYRDSIHLGIRMHEGFRSETTVWMYKLGPGDTRVEPVLYQVPYHHLWLVELADKFRSKSQPGEGPERP
ncbi:hypothetical protein [Alicyclobacillus mengziensis]|uniref:hypothetical protein n=1 Tax=Alicyclobacillus mengziensis TaxID=2931921 RepID=UPI002013346C|nr:hypothetical protein [Alicyclobacillus mengziensis]